MYSKTTLDHHIALTSSEDLKEICKPLFELLGIQYFAFHRIYQDGSIIRLSTYPEWSKRYITQNYFKDVALDHYTSTRQTYEYHLWDYYSKYDPKSLPIIRESYNDFSLNCGFTIFKNHEEYSEQYIFAGLNNRKVLDPSIYLTQIEVIENFIQQHFLIKAHSLIVTAHSDPLTPHFLSISGLSVERLPKVRNFLSNQEGECLKYLVKGNTFKQIGRILNLSPRTVEAYIANVKKKTGSIHRCELVAKVYEEGLLLNQELTVL